MSNVSKAKNCPFCGGKADGVRWFDESVNVTSVRCSNKDCIASFKSVELKVWNSRADNTPTTQREADERKSFEAWMKTCPGYPFAGAFANLMWDAWQARASLTPTAPQAASQQAECWVCNGAGVEFTDENVSAPCRRCGVPQAATTASASDDDKWFFITPDERAAFAPVQAAQPALPASGDQIKSYEPGRWFDARTIDEMQAFYLSRLPAIREAAKELGYAIGLHGSTRRDFDLLAMQWRDGAADKDALARAIADAACGIRREGAYDWEVKPSGRVATSIPICWTAHDNPDFDNMVSAGHIDLSMIDIAAPGAAQTTDAREAAPLPKADALVKRSEWDDALEKRQSFNGWRLNYGDCDMKLYTEDTLREALARAPLPAKAKPIAWRLTTIAPEGRKPLVFLFDNEEEASYAHSTWAGSVLLPLYAGPERDEIADLPDLLSSIMWLYRRTPVAFDRLPSVEKAIKRLGQITGTDVSDSLKERVIRCQSEADESIAASLAGKDKK